MVLRPAGGYGRVLQTTMDPATPLLERERELSAMREVVAAARHHRGGVVLVEAAAGLGKTSLLRAAAAMFSDADFACLTARAADLERDFAYGCVRQLFEAEVSTTAGAERERLFAGAAALAEPLFAPPGGALPSSANSALLMRHGLYWLLNNRCADGPLALLVDDLHWSDIESLRLLAYLAPRLDGLPVAVIATCRPGEGDDEEIARLATAPETTTMRLAGLSADATAALCAGRLGDEVDRAFASACHTATAGNPLFLEALLRELAERGVAPDEVGATSVHSMGPREVVRAVRLRLSRQPADVLPLVRALAVLGERCRLADAAALAGLEEHHAAVAVDRLVALGILHPAGGLEFAHPIVREAVYADIGPRRRAAMHACAVRVLADAGAPEERIAAQVVAAEPAGDERRVELLRRVAAEALARGAPAATVAWLERALTEPPAAEFEGEILHELSLAKLRLGTPDAAVDQLGKAAELVRDPALVARSVRMLAEALTWIGKAERAVAVTEQALERIDDREQALLLEAERAACAQLAGLVTRARVTAQLERHADLDGGSRGERLVLATLAFARARASETAADAVLHPERVLADGRLIDEQDLDVAGTLYLLLIGLLPTDALDLIESSLERMLVQAAARGSIPAQAFAVVHRGWVSLQRGAVAPAEADARAALDLLTTYDIPLGTSYARALLIRTLLERGDIDAAEQALGRDDEEPPPGLTSNSLIEARALLRLAQGRTGEAVTGLLDFGRHDEHYGSAHPCASRWRSHAALALAAAGDHTGAREFAADDLERARRWGTSSGIGIALRTNALVDPGPDAIALLQDAADALERSPADLEHARALTDLGAALRRANRRVEGRDALEPAVRIAERLGASALAERARTELRAAGGRTGDPHGVGVAQLTASERRVAELAAQGRTNPEIAQELFVTRKTVETHLGRVYRKLDIPGRGKLPGMFHATAP